SQPTSPSFTPCNLVRITSHIGVSEEAFQGVTPSFYFSKIQFSVISLYIKLLLTCRNFSSRNVSH
ncbi:MAG: hypothetical protein ACRDB6_08940, partial [Cetobacterium sp.]